MRIKHLLFSALGCLILVLSIFLTSCKTSNYNLSFYDNETLINKVEVNIGFQEQYFMWELYTL